MIQHITDPHDQRLIPYRDLTDAQAAARHGLFIAEGRFVVRTLLTTDRYRARSVLVTQAALMSLRDLIDPLAGISGRPDVPVYVAPSSVLEAVAGFDVHRGCLAAAERGPEPHSRDVLAHLAPGPALVLVLEDLTNHDNVGGIFRSAAAFGAAGVLLTPACVDPLYRKAVRVSMGSVLRVPWGRGIARPGEPSAAAALLDGLKSAGFISVALTTADDAMNLRDAVARATRERSSASRRIALLLGAEGPGLSPALQASADIRARIRIAPEVDSLNVGVAAAIALYALMPALGRDLD